MSTVPTVPAGVPGALEPAVGARVREVLRHVLVLTRRNLRRSVASPGQIIDATLMPVTLAVIFLYAFGGAIAGDSAQYRQYLIPGIMALTITITCRTAGLALHGDFASGMMDRYRSMPVARSAALAARILADAVRMLASQLIILAFGLLIGFRVHTGVLAALAAVGIVLLYGMALCCLQAFIGLAARGIETVQSVSTLVMVPFQFGSSIFVAPATMPGWLRLFVENNPMTAVVDCARALLTGGPVASSAALAVAWSVGLIAVFAPLSVWKYRTHR
ncbi:ABC transporter permease [Streptomyces sp. NPDC004267]|uniref:ABC transporter permease n=1 Tax=Streptomyces sp. NPDC004267 TaxID=3364694 RepID=UPI0036B68A62